MGICSSDNIESFKRLELNRKSLINVLKDAPLKSSPYIILYILDKLGYDYVVKNTNILNKLVKVLIQGINLDTFVKYYPLLKNPNNNKLIEIAMRSDNYEVAYFLGYVRDKF